MTVGKGSAFLLKSGSGDPLVYRTLAGLRASEFSIANDGERVSVSVVAQGIMLGSPAEAELRQNALSGTLNEYQLSFENGDRYNGRFLINRLVYAGDFNGERNYSITLTGDRSLSPDRGNGE